MDSAEQRRIDITGEFRTIYMRYSQQGDMITAWSALTRDDRLEIDAVVALGLETQAQVWLNGESTETLDLDIFTLAGWVEELTPVDPQAGDEDQLLASLQKQLAYLRNVQDMLLAHQLVGGDEPSPLEPLLQETAQRDAALGLDHLDELERPLAPDDVMVEIVKKQIGEYMRAVIKLPEYRQTQGLNPVRSMIGKIVIQRGCVLRDALNKIAAVLPYTSVRNELQREMHRLCFFIHNQGVEEDGSWSLSESRFGYTDTLMHQEHLEASLRTSVTASLEHAREAGEIPEVLVQRPELVASILDAAARATDKPVCIAGPAGSGKTVIASEIGASSNFDSGPVVLAIGHDEMMDVCGQLMQQAYAERIPNLKNLARGIVDAVLVRLGYQARDLGLDTSLQMPKQEQEYLEQIMQALGREVVVVLDDIFDAFEHPRERTAGFEALDNTIVLELSWVAEFFAPFGIKIVYTSHKAEYGDERFRRRNIAEVIQVLPMPAEQAQEMLPGVELPDWLVQDGVCNPGLLDAWRCATEEKGEANMIEALNYFMWKYVLNGERYVHVEIAAPRLRAIRELGSHLDLETGRVSCLDVDGGELDNIHELMRLGVVRLEVISDESQFPWLYYIFAPPQFGKYCQAYAEDEKRRESS